MKKVLPQIILLLLIYLGIFFTVGERNPIMLEASLREGWLSLDQIPKKSEAGKIIRDIKSDSTKMKWEYIKKRLFPKEYTPVVDRLNDSIVLHTINASYADSLAILKALDKVQRIIPQLNITYQRDFDDNESYTNHLNKNQPPFDESRFFIRFNDVKPDDPLEGTVLGSSQAFLFKNNQEGYIEGYTEREILYTKPPYKYLRVQLDYRLLEELIDTKREKYIEFGIFRLLGQIQSNDQATLEGGNGSFPYYQANFFEQLNDSISDKDIFLFKKLKSDDFHDQFAEYMYDTYPWRYANHFLNEDKAKVIAIVIICLLATLILILAFSLFYNINFKYQVLHYILPLLIFWIFYIELSWFYNYLTDMHYMQDYGGNIEFQLMATALSIVSGVVLYFSERLSFVRKNFVFSLCFKVLVTFIVLISPIIIIALTKEGAWEAAISTEFFISFIIPILILSLGRGVLIYLNHYSENLVKEKDLELSSLREANTTAQLRLLQSQINPHFLYNSLNSIAGLAHKDADKTEQMALSLSDLFRYTVGKKNKDFSTLAEEIEMVKRYLEIEQIRFGERLDFNIEIEDDLKNQEIPRFILQPLVENAIKHGVSKIEDVGVVRLRVTSQNDFLQIKVSDNGPEFSDGLLNGHGLQSVFDLLQLHYAKKASLKWINEPQKAVLIQIPKKS